jgi:hypothetical protein
MVSGLVRGLGCGGGAGVYAGSSGCGSGSVCVSDDVNVRAGLTVACDEVERVSNSPKACKRCCRRRSLASGESGCTQRVGGVSRGRSLGVGGGGVDGGLSGGFRNLRALQGSPNGVPRRGLKS